MHHLKHLPFCCDESIQSLFSSYFETHNTLVNDALLCGRTPEPVPSASSGTQSHSSVEPEFCTTDGTWLSAPRRQPLRGRMRRTFLLLAWATTTRRPCLEVPVNAKLGKTHLYREKINLQMKHRSNLWTEHSNNAHFPLLGSEILPKIEAGVC